MFSHELVFYYYYFCRKRYSGLTNTKIISRKFTQNETKNRYCNSNPKTICPILNKICFLEYYQLLFLTRKFLHGQWKLTQTALIKNKLRCNEHLKKPNQQCSQPKVHTERKNWKQTNNNKKKGMHFSFPITEFISAIQKSCDILTTVVAIKIISSVKTAC